MATPAGSVIDEPKTFEERRGAADACWSSRSSIELFDCASRRGEHALDFLRRRRFKPDVDLERVGVDRRRHRFTDEPTRWIDEIERQERSEEVARFDEVAFMHGQFE